MATERPSRGKNTTLNLIGLEPGEARPDLAVVAVGADGKVTYSATVDDKGQFELPESALKSAHRILLGPAGISPAQADKSAFARYRPAQFAKLLEAGTINVARPQWELWRFFFTCVTGTVRVCRRSPWWFEELEVLATKPFSLQATRELQTSARTSVARSLPELIFWPYRCSPICNGTVDVYRRRCCCQPWVLDDPRLDDLLRELEILVRWPPRPWPPDPGPNPGPDPAPVLRSAGPSPKFFKDGTLDELALYAARDLATLKSLPRSEIAGYVSVRPYLFCRGYSCGTPVKVATGSINPDGRFNICFIDWGQPVLPNCHYEYAYIVRQPFGPFQVTVYNGVAANAWFSGGAQADLVSYHALAFACREPGEPGTGAFVYLDVIGDTLSHELHTPVSTGPDRVASATGNDGLVSPSGSPAVINRNWGGTVKLNYMFSEDMRLLGAKYYRVSITPADDFGAPTAPPIPWDVGLSWRKAISGGDIVPVSLGPNPVGGQQALYEIPYDTGLPPTENWEANQYHVHLDTNDARWNDPAVRHLVMLEIFDSTGQRLCPNGTLPTGLAGAEATVDFTYRRRIAATGPTNVVPFGALTHLFWWDNRPLTAEIAELVQDGTASDEVCQFLVGDAGSQFGIKYRAYHPEEKFQDLHAITWYKGLNGGSGPIPNAAPPLNVGVPPLDPQPSGTVSFGTMLGDHTRCAFSVRLDVYGKLTDGDDYGQPHVWKSAAFALEIGTT